MKIQLLIFILSISFGLQAQFDKKWAVNSIFAPLTFTGEIAKADSFDIFKRNLYGLSTTSIFDTASLSLVYSNSGDIVCQNGDTIKNCRSLVDDTFRREFPVGTGSQDFTILLPKKENEYYSINRSSDASMFDGNFNMITNITYYGYFDIKKKEVLSSKNILNTIVPTNNFLAVTRHGNGRDFWIAEKAWQGNTYYIYRTTPDTIVLENTQTIGDSASFGDVLGMGGFSPMGDKLGYACGTQHPQVFDFDRCTGLLSNPIKIPAPWYDENNVMLRPSPGNPTIGQCALNFSPSGRFLYTNNFYRIYQFDLWAGDSLAIQNSRTLIAKWDSSYITNWNSYRPFFESKVSPNNKIYYGTPEARPNALSVINYPDSPGVVCGFVPFGLPVVYGNSPIPNVPHYALGAKIGSGCDTAFTTSIGREIEKIDWQLYPNPASSELNISLLGDASVAVADMMGRAVWSGAVIDKTKLSTQGWAAGVYQVFLVKEGKRGVRKLIIDN